MPAWRPQQSLLRVRSVGHERPGGAAMRGVVSPPRRAVPRPEPGRQDDLNRWDRRPESGSEQNGGRRAEPQRPPLGSAGTLLPLLALRGTGRPRRAGSVIGLKERRALRELGGCALLAPAGLGRRRALAWWRSRLGGARPLAGEPRAGRLLWHMVRHALGDRESPLEGEIGGIRCHYRKSSATLVRLEVVDLALPARSAPGRP